MDKSPFVEQPLANPNILQRVLGRQPKFNAVVELCNVLAARGVQSVTDEDVDDFSKKYSVNLLEKFRTELLDLYRQYLAYCLSDRHLTDEEVGDLAHLKRLFGITDTETTELHNEISSAIYKESLEAAIADGRLDQDEKDFLKMLQSEIGIPESVADEIYAQSAKARLEAYLAEAIDDSRLSPDEERELEQIAQSLGAEIKFEGELKTTLEKYRLFWQIENGDVPTIQADINLQRNEECYFKCDVDWYEHRRQTRRIRYAGPTARIRLAKGIYYRAGDLGFQKVSEDVSVKIDTGPVYVTSKRLLFRGQRKNKTIRLSKIIDFTPYVNGVQIEKDAGKSPFLAFERDVDLFSVILGRAIVDL